MLKLSYLEEVYKDMKFNSNVCNFYIGDIEGIYKTNYKSPLMHKWEWPRERVRKTDSVIYILGGEAMICPGNNKFYVKTGDIVHRPVHLPYTAQGIKGPFYYFNISFEADTKNAVLNTVIHDEKQYFLKKFETLFTRWNNKKGQYILECKAMIYSLMAELLSEQEFINRSDKKYELLSKATTYIDNNISNPYFSIGELLTFLNVSDTYFRRIFKERYNVVPVKYISDLRMTTAEDYLKNSDMSIRKISETTGFSDISYFSKSFKARTGMSPSLYREKFRFN
ncbi:MAG: helix-turn-helix domain-containing protein [Ruminococcaceae bacterium]|nr:helix-turn-helix domain-containing protein [Oscillospiraceae bacterium]